MMKGLMGDENMSNLTCASGDLSASNSSIRNESSSAGTLYPQQQSSSANDIQQPQQPPPPKKKRNLPGNPDPDAEVIALSPKSLMATNRFLCEICNKGFQREQNLQLHRRGHNLPWKLKQRTNKEVRKKVYLCPEPTCVHHDPSRALGDLTGIKKHFCRKHGEKKWKCEKCSKRYAVQSDWKAHSKICGTREYRCDCGTLFSRRDSFITHRAFCDALAQENSTSTAARSAMPASINPLLSSLPQLHTHGLQGLSVKREQDQQQQLLPPWLSCLPEGEATAPSGLPSMNMSSPLFSASSFQHYYSFDHQNPNPSSSSTTTLPDFQQPHTASPHMSATALLQKASEMGATISKPSHSPMFLKPPSHQAHVSNEAFDDGFGSNDNKSSLLHDMMMMSNSFGDQQVSSAFGDHRQAFNGIMVDGNNNFVEINNNNNNINPPKNYKSMELAQLGRSGTDNNNNDEGLTRDFLGLRAPFSSSAAAAAAASHGHGDFFNINMAGLNHHVNSSSSSAYNGQQSDHQNQTSWQECDDKAYEGAEKRFENSTAQH
ncbi:unnamed protein product [Prunus armeniaca]|uniref:C2H2-type domain-containing protein n=1 Tax=Prunus armeniaca TaxID=36596 RepID=A0A6J5WB37_PRUAR|nr:unnamed protein product [Prunus armeniaca]